MILVSPLSGLRSVIAETAPSHVLSLLSPGSGFIAPAGVDAHLLLEMNDIAERRDGLVAPDGGHVAAMIEFARQWDRRRPLLVHCLAGISRSTAAAYVIAAALMPGRDETELARRLRSLSPSATPNPRIVSLADRMMNRNGRMIAAIAAIGRGADATEGVPFRLDLEADAAWSQGGGA
jgi:predicted protein tyrosine phosphatase